MKKEIFVLTVFVFVALFSGSASALEPCRKGHLLEESMRKIGVFRGHIML